MRLRGTTPSRTAPAPMPMKTGTKLCPRTGRTLIDRGHYDEILPPPVPPKTSGYGTTAESVLAHAHYLLASGWNDPDSRAIHAASDSYSRAVKTGWFGSRDQWHDNVYAGALLHGEMRPPDKTPKKVIAKLRAN